MPPKRIKATRQLFEERFAFGGGTVDRSDPNHPIVKGVLLCGPASQNNFVGEGSDRVVVKGRRYLAKAFAGERVQRYADRLVYLNHPARTTDRRDYRDKIATIKNPRHRDDGMPVGDLAVNPKHPLAEQFLWDAENAPNSCGMSHRAYCKWSTSKDGYADAEDIEEVLSVDIVTDSATTGGIFEHKEPRMSSTVKAVAEWVAKHPKSTSAQCLKMKLLAEDYGDMEVAEPAEDAEPGATVDQAFKDLMHAHLDEMLDGSQTVDEFVKKVKALQKAHAGKGDKEEPAAKDDEEAPPEEGRKRGIGYDKALSLIAEAKFNATPTEIRMIARSDSDSDAKAYMAEQLARTGEKPPRSSGRTTAVPPKAAPVQEGRSFPAWDDPVFAR